LEHLLPRSLGGTDDAANLVVCHQHCNMHLKDRPREQKEAMRLKWQRAPRHAHSYPLAQVEEDYLAPPALSRFREEAQSIGKPNRARLTRPVGVQTGEEDDKVTDIFPSKMFGLRVQPPSSMPPEAANLWRSPSMN